MTMHTLIRASVFALAMQQAESLAAELAAQGAGGAATRTNAACALVTEKEVEAATGLDYGPGEHFDELNVGVGKATCVWVVEDLPEIGVDFFPASAGGSNTEARAKGKPRARCTRESVRGVGERAFVETCEGFISSASVNARSSASVYARTGRSDIAVVVYLKRGESMASPIKAVAIALAKAAAARAKGK
jgi:hypothetical protein